MNTPDPASRREFVNFWSLRYSDPNERLYTSNINRERTAQTLAELFKWKIGPRLFASTLERTVGRHFLSRIDVARSLPSGISAAAFLDLFRGGGAIYRIFWLHCWYPQRFPIYDQHVHRAMAFICSGKIEELHAHRRDEEKLQAYIER